MRPPTNSAATNCQPSRIHITRPNSATKSVAANWNAASDETPDAPFLNRVLAGATAKTLFKKGASGVSSLAAFQFAATDLVAELGLVMWILLGWQFVAAEFVGGLIAVGVLAYVYRDVVPDEWFAVARQHALKLDEVTCPACEMTADPSDDDTVEATWTARPNTSAVAAVSGRTAPATTPT